MCSLEFAATFQDRSRPKVNLKNRRVGTLLVPINTELDRIFVDAPFSPSPNILKGVDISGDKPGTYINHNRQNLPGKAFSFTRINKTQETSDELNTH